MIPIYIGMYLFIALGLSILTDGPFSDILEKFGQRWNLPKQIVAATWMAMASSGPELFTSVVDTFYFKNMIGIGTIVGSAIFNILIIIAAAAAFAQGPLKIDPKPIIRDVCWYVFVTVVLILTNLTGKNTVWNMWALFSTYIYYIFYLMHDTRLTQQRNESANMNRLQSRRSWKTIITVLRAKKRLCSPKKERESQEQLAATDEVAITIEEEQRDSTGINSPRKTKSSVEVSETTPPCHTRCGGMIKSCCGNLLFESWNKLFQYTIPTSDRYLKLGFAMCVFWIIVFTYILVECCNQFASAMGIPPILTGLLLLAPTTSLPDAMASIVMAREGEGDSAIVNAISSNIFDIAVGHGLPHFLNCFGGDHDYIIDQAGIRGYIALGISLLVFGLSLYLRNWTLDNCTAIILTLTYFVYVAVEVVYQR